MTEAVVDSMAIMQGEEPKPEKPQPPPHASMHPLCKTYLDASMKQWMDIWAAKRQADIWSHAKRYR